MTSSSQSSSPGDEELLLSVRELRQANQTLGIAKLLALLKTEHPSWLVSEKRLRKVLSSLDGPTVATGDDGGQAKVKENNLVAETGIDETIDMDIAPKVKVKMFSGGKGKGLVARQKILMGEVIWQEEPWIVSPDPTLYQYLMTQRMCTQCFTVFPRPNPPLSVPCPHCNTAHFCNRLCLSRATISGAHHPYLCPGLNPEANDLLSLTASKNWRALDVVAKIWAVWRGNRQTTGGGSGKYLEKRVWNGMARVNMQKRETEKKEWEYVGEMHIRQWKIGYTLLKSLLDPSPSEPNFKSTQKFIAGLHPKRKFEPLTEEEDKKWFSYDGFLELLGLANLNQEDSGGLYALHAHLNHSCEPNIMVRNMPKNYQPPAPNTLPCDVPPPNITGIRGTNKLTIIARKTINPGEELCISYVNPEMDVESRRQALREGYGFWCSCPRCIREKKVKPAAKIEEVAGDGAKSLEGSVAKPEAIPGKDSEGHGQVVESKVSDKINAEGPDSSIAEEKRQVEKDGVQDVEDAARSLSLSDTGATSADKPTI